MSSAQIGTKSQDKDTINLKILEAQLGGTRETTI